VATAVAADALGSWGIPVAAGVVAIVAATATSLELVDPSVGLAVAVVGLLVVMIERSLHPALAAATPGPALVAAIGLGWVVACYLPFHGLFFPGPPLHAPITLHAGDRALPVSLPAHDHSAVDFLLEAELPPNPAGGTAIPVQYTIVVEDGAQARQTLTGRFDESLRTQRLGRRGTATVIQAHHAERRLVSNAAGGDLTITTVGLDPSDGASVTVTAHVHRLPSTPVLVVLALALLGAAVAVDARIIPESDGSLTHMTGAALGTALMLWTSNTVHPTVSSLIGSIIFGGPLGFGAGALVWAIARRTLVHAGR
jgi:hypothetical protein